MNLCCLTQEWVTSLLLVHDVLQWMLCNHLEHMLQQHQVALVVGWNRTTAYFIMNCVLALPYSCSCAYVVQYFTQDQVGTGDPKRRAATAATKLQPLCMASQWGSTHIYQAAAW